MPESLGYDTSAHMGNQQWMVLKNCKILAKNKYDQIQPEFDERDENFDNESSQEVFNFLLNITTGEANSVVRRSLGSRWLA